MSEKKALIGMKDSEIENIISQLGEKSFRSKQIKNWLYKSISAIEDMNNIPKNLIERLKKDFKLYSMEIDTVEESKEDETTKYLFKLADDKYIEGVFMKYKYGNTMCISSQAGCRMGCVFCASTIDGLKRNLRESEMLEQILLAQNHRGESINHIVVMGSGEPFDNYDNLKKFIELVNRKDVLNMGMRNITVSTCGLVPQIKMFAQDFPQVNLAISLHETQDDKRDMLMPINKKFNIEELIEACKYYIEKTNRRITFEYALAEGKNDSLDDMKGLVRLLKGLNCHINLIPLNFVKEIGIRGSSRKSAQNCKEVLEKFGMNATVRRELGSDINGACGQLRMLKRT